MKTETKVIIVGGLYGLALGMVGFSFLTWQYWTLFALFLIYGYIQRSER